MLSPDVLSDFWPSSSSWRPLPARAWPTAGKVPIWVLTASVTPLVLPSALTVQPSMNTPSRSLARVAGSMALAGTLPATVSLPETL